MTAKTDLAIATVRIIGFNIGCFMPDGQLVFIQLTPVLPTEQYEPTISKLSIVLEVLQSPTLFVKVADLF